MLPLIFPIVAQLAPSLIDWLFGSKAEKTAAAVVSAVQTVTGADPTTADGAAAVQAMIQNKPDIALQLQQQLVTVRAQMQAEANREADAQRQADLTAMQAAIADVANARAQTVDLAKASSPIAYGSVVVSALAMLTFIVVTALALTRRMPEGSEAILSILVGTVATLPTAVISYWLGSSASSARHATTLDKVLTGGGTGAGQ